MAKDRGCPGTERPTTWLEYWGLSPEIPAWPLGKGGGLENECKHVPVINQSCLGNDTSIKTLTLMVGWASLVGNTLRIVTHGCARKITHPWGQRKPGVWNPPKLLPMHLFFWLVKYSAVSEVCESFQWIVKSTGVHGDPQTWGWYLKSWVELATWRAVLNLQSLT